MLLRVKKTDVKNPLGFLPPGLTVELFSENPEMLCSNHAGTKINGRAFIVLRFGKEGREKIGAVDLLYICIVHQVL